MRSGNRFGHRSAFPISLLILSVSIVQIVRNLFTILRERNFIDFMVYYQAASAYLSGANPYHRLYVEKPGIPFNYPPGSILFFSGFTLFPPYVTETALVMVSMLLLGISVWIIVDRMHFRIPIAVIALCLAFALQTFPVKFTLVLGQVNLLVLGLTMVSLYAYSRGRIHTRHPGWFLVSIVLFASASTLKLFPLYLLPLFVCMGDWLFICSVVVLFMIMNMIPSVTLSIEYFTRILPGLASFGTPAFYDQSIIALFLRMDIANIRYVWIIVSWILATYVFLYVTYRKNAVLATSAIYRTRVMMYFGTLIMALTSIGGSFSWQHHLVFSYPLIVMAFFLEYKRKQSSIRRNAVLGVVMIFWAAMVFHFRDETSVMLAYPLVASYQTISVLVLIGGTIALLPGHIRDFLRSDTDI